jgi:hypothetical protein
VTKAAPTQILLKDGCKPYAYDTPSKELERVIASARKRGDEKVTIDRRPIQLDRILKVLTEETQ